MQIEMMEINSITPYVKNPRKNKKAIGSVAKSIKEFGFQQPLVVDENNIIVVGHTRYMAAKELGMTKVPVHRAINLTKNQVKAYRIADNKSSELAEWDYDILIEELSDLKDDIHMTLFSSEDLEIMLSELSSDIKYNGAVSSNDKEFGSIRLKVTPGQTYILGTSELKLDDVLPEAELFALSEAILIYQKNSGNRVILKQKTDENI